MADPPDAVPAALARLAAATLGFDDGRLLGGVPEAGWTEADRAVLAGRGPLARSDSDGCYLGVRVDTDDEVLGVLRLTATSPRAIPERQVALLGQFARLAALHLRPAAAGPDRLTTELAAALAGDPAAGAIVPHYQPVVRLDTEQVVGLEALARWRRPDGGYEQPAAFIPVAERSDLIADLDLVVIGQGLADLHRWQRDAPDVRLSVNLSGRHLDHPDGPDRLDALTAAAGVSPATVDLELTETARPRDAALGERLLAELRERGYAVWLDDFGAGYYDLRDLVRLPVDGIKIDRAFAAQLDRPVNHALVGALTAAAERVGLAVTIEGIETAEQAELARALGCHRAQGFWWSRPVPADQVPRWLSPAPTTAPPS